MVRGPVHCRARGYHNAFRLLHVFQPLSNHSCVVNRARAWTYPYPTQRVQKRTQHVHFRSLPLRTAFYLSPSTYHRGPLYVPDVQTQQDIILSLINHGADPMVGQLVPGIEGEVSILAEASSPKTRNLLANIQLARRTGLAFGALRGLAQRPRTATLVTSYVKALRGL